jgi:Antibiotic biosynthesis monooxygenase
MGLVIAITRYRVPTEEAEVFAGQARAVLEALAGCRGHRSGRLGHAADDPELWVMCTEWDGAGFYRRALGEVRMLVIPMSVWAVDEPGAYEIVA